MGFMPAHSCTFYMYGRVAVQSEESTISGGYIDSAVITLTDVEDVVAQFVVLEIFFDGLAVPAPQTLCLGGQPDMLAAVFHHAVHAVQVFKDVFQLVCLTVSLHLEQAMPRGANEHVAVLSLQQTGNVTGNCSALQVVGGNGAESLAVENLQGTVHADEETAVVVLGHAVDVVAGHTQLLASLLFIYTELVAVVSVQSVTGGHPYKSVFIEIDLCGEAARHLLVSIEELSHLSMNTKAVHQAEYAE